MEYINTTNDDFVEIMRQVHDITNSGKTVKKVLNFIDKNRAILGEDEYFVVKEEPPRFPPGFVGMMILQSKYSINIKKTTILILALLFDSTISLPVASGILSATGFQTKSFSKINDKDRCVIIDVIAGKKKDFQDFEYYGKACVEKEIECPFRNGLSCQRTKSDIEEIINTLINDGVILKENGAYKQCF